MNFNEENVGHTPMCKLCGEYEVGTFQAHTEFCSDMCADKAYGYLADVEYDTDGQPVDTQGWYDDMSMYDDDPSPYAGTYSEE